MIEFGSILASTCGIGTEMNKMSFCTRRLSYRRSVGLTLSMGGAYAFGHSRIIFRARRFVPEAAFSVSAALFAIMQPDYSVLREALLQILRENLEACLVLCESRRASLNFDIDSPHKKGKPR